MYDSYRYLDEQAREMYMTIIILNFLQIWQVNPVFQLSICIKDTEIHMISQNLLMYCNTTNNNKKNT